MRKKVRCTDILKKNFLRQVAILKLEKHVYKNNLVIKVTELAENLGVKNAKWDKEDGYYVPRDCYNSYFYIVEDENTNLLDKFILHGDKLTKYLDGRQNCLLHLFH